MHPPAYFEDVRKGAAKRWDQLESDPELAAPWHQLFKQVQSPRHVVSELLQNADDAGATSACVAIDGSDFVFNHNGEDFQHQHFSSLCRFGYSNKRALHTIGFRGIGFKSTFSIGDEVRLHTPTLSVAFRKKRFTEPRWLNGDGKHSDGTSLRVTFQDELRKAELTKNLARWLDSPTSLLFFRSLRKFRIGDDEVVWTSKGAGPVPDSEWMVSSANGDEPVLLIRSQLEEFPPEAIDEIRQERMLSDAEDATLPPCKVEIVLGLEGLLFVVLPTGVKTSLPFACNAPFVQDPARVKIKDPETSPTNRWLLERAGRLAARTMLSWLRSSDLTKNERAAAYQLLIESDNDDDSIEGACTTIVAEAFAAEIEGEHFLLADNGTLTEKNECVAVPQWLRDVWSQGQISSLFDTLHRPLLAFEVTGAFRRSLVSEGYLPEIAMQRILETLRDNHLPRPKSWRNLLALWDAVAPSVTQPVPNWQPNWKNLCIVPVQGQDCLYSAAEVVRLGEKRLLHSDADWEFLSRYLRAMNPNWGRFLTDQRRTAESTEDLTLATQLQAAERVIQAIGLAETSDASKVLSKVATAFFEQEECEISDCVRLAHIAAALAAKVDQQFHFVTQDGTLACRASTHPLIADARFDLDSILNETWCSQHTLHSDYWTEFSSCTQAEWDDWIASGQSGLLRFVPIESRDNHVYGKYQLRQELQARGCNGEPTYRYKTDNFIIEDRNFAEEHWRHWETLARGDKSFWAKLLARIFEQPASYWSQHLNATAYHVATTGSRQSLAVGNFLPAWIVKLRSKACLQDTWGHFREPTDLLRRTADTESLLDVEPFVRAEHDVESLRPLLVKLGVRDTPSSPRRLVERLQALATIASPPIYEVQKWCHRIDSMLPKCSTQEFQDLKATFHNQKLILTSEGSWARAAEVFLNADEHLVPGSAIVHPDLRQLTIWQKIGVTDRPTVEVVMAWLAGLPRNERLPQDELRRIRELLPKHAHRIWNECGCWLNLEGEWTETDELKYSISMQSLSAWSHLFPAIKRQVADFTRLPAEVVHQPPFSTLPSLASRLEERVQSNLMPTKPATVKEWLAALGDGLSRVVSDSEEKNERIRAHGRRLTQTVWQTTALLETVPFLDGVPAGTARPNDVLWEGHTLFVEDRPLAKMVRQVARELARPFDDTEVEDAIKFCWERSADQVLEYLEQNFTLAMPSEESASNGQQAPTASEDTESVEKAEAVERETETDLTESDDDQQEWEAEENEPDQPETEQDVQVDDDQPMPQVRHSSRPKQLTLMERYAQVNGFKKDAAQDRFFHPDGRWIQKSHGLTFPWELYSASGELLCCYLAKDHCIQTEPLQICAEVWEGFRRNPSAFALISTNGDGSPEEYTGRQLLDMKDAGQLVLYPATYRLAIQPQEHRKGGNL
jgi:hypothetical protein